MALYRIWAIQALGDLELGLGRPTASVVHHEAQRDELARHGTADVDLSPAPELVDPYLRLGRARDAARAAEPFVAAAEAKGQPWALARAARCRGLVADRGWDEAFDEATELHARTPNLFEELGARPWAEQARSELAATGQRARRRDPSTLDALTPQELQIARLLADGMTVRDAAASAFLSPKTVEYHLRNAYRKLGIRSRAELAGALASGRRPSR
jgi:DNA-binding CsgD family transcriptional regulator